MDEFKKHITADDVTQELIEKLCIDIVESWDMNTLIDYAVTTEIDLCTHKSPEDVADDYNEFYNTDENFIENDLLAVVDGSGEMHYFSEDKIEINGKKYKLVQVD